MVVFAHGSRVKCSEEPGGPRGRCGLRSAGCLTLSEIHAALDDAGESLGTPRVIAWSAVGVALAVVALIGTILESAPRANHVIAGYLVLVVLAAPSHWFVAFTGGMGIADAFATSGGDHAPWGGLLYMASGLALLALVGIAVRRMWLRSAWSHGGPSFLSTSAGAMTPAGTQPGCGCSRPRHPGRLARRLSRRWG